MNNKKSFDDRIKEAGCAPLDADEVFGKEMKSYTNELKLKDDKKVINHPARYGGDTTYECIKVLQAWVSEEEYRGFLRCNAIKYLCRAGKKDEIVQELKKSVWYINKLIESYEGQNNETGN